MNILHTESSNGWGGQEIRILKEALGLLKRKHKVFLAVVKGGKLADYAKKSGLIVYEVDFRRCFALSTLKKLVEIIRKEKIEVVNTHSSLDAWIGGIAARLTSCRVVRTRHLSTPVRGGLNASLLYRGLADFIVTTSSAIIPHLAQQARLPLSRFSSVPTGVEPFNIVETEKKSFRAQLGVDEKSTLVGTVCVVRSWKGIQDLIKAAQLLKQHSNIKWVVIGGGYIEHFTPLLDPSTPLTFFGHLDEPFSAMAGLDIFVLLSTAHEGVSQASLQAAFLKKPLVATPIGGLSEICIDRVTGIVVPPSSPKKVAEAVLQLALDSEKRRVYGEAAYRLVNEKFMFKETLNQMEKIFSKMER